MIGLLEDSTTNEFTTFKKSSLFDADRYLKPKSSEKCFTNRLDLLPLCPAAAIYLSVSSPNCDPSLL